MQTPLPGCTICGRDRTVETEWFLLIESHWQDKVKILQWSHQLASQAGVHAVCCPAHAQELVVHWMTTGSLEYPFARTKADRRRRPIPFSETASDVDTRVAHQIGELAIHRESIQRILRENPHSLMSILDALLAALQREQPPARAVSEELEDLCVEQGVV